MYRQDILPPCSNGCPVNTNVSGYLDAITGGDYMEAYRLLSDRNPFSTVCGWVCPHPCEDNCRRGTVDKPLSIRALKRFAIEEATGTASITDISEEIILTDFEKKSVNKDFLLTQGDVAIIGGGPSGMAAALDLSRMGYSVTVLEKQPEAGGHFYTSLPLYRLPRRVLKQDIKKISENGVKIICGVEAGKDFTIEELRSKYKAVVIAVGLQISRTLPLAGFDHPDVLLALPFLQAANSGESIPLGKRVLVVGGGNVAMDVARTAVRLGAERVESVCLESPEEMPANPWEVEEAHEEGVIISCSWGPEEIVIENNKVTGLRLKKVTSVFDCQGQFCPTFDDTVKQFLEADTIIVAVGQRADLGFIENSDIPLDERGNLRLDRNTLSSPVSGIFVCGEVAQGPGAAISAVASGQKVAGSVDSYLKSGKALYEKEVLPVINCLPEDIAQKVKTRQRQNYQVADSKERKKNFLPFEKSFLEKEARLESSRCMRCGLGAQVIEEKCVSCLTCARLCPYGIPKVDGLAVISVEECQGCGICASACPAGAIDMVAGICGQGWIEKDEKDRDNSEIIFYLCRYLIGKEINPDFMGVSMAGLDNIRIKILPSADSLEQRTILKDFENNVKGIALVACEGEECPAGGNMCRGNEFKEAKKTIQDIGLNPEIMQYIKADNNALNNLSEFVKGLK
ncbi:MAG: FAD-dependent oxidoreductase [Peptococcaceae bacterium]|nr:FAD-dependent oxidoreductase [Peptococcaceae bacterium]